MSEYKTLKGFDIQVLSSDPSPTALGQMWYNTTDRELRVVKNVGAWSAGGNVNNATTFLSGHQSYNILSKKHLRKKINFEYFF